MNTDKIPNIHTIMFDSLLTALEFQFMQRALLGGLIIAVTTAVLSVYVTLRNMSFYANAISHSALAGIAIGVMLGVAPYPSAVVFCVLLGLFTAVIKRYSSVSTDTLMGVLFSSGMALGVVLISQLENFRTDIFTLLFGDILGISTTDIIIASVIAVIILVYMKIYSKQLLLTTFSSDFSKVRGLNYSFLDYTFFVATALTVALSIKIIGLILVTGLLVLPAAIAKNMARSFKEAKYLALGFSISSTIIGIMLSYYIDTPSGPTIILVSTGFFILSTILRRTH